MAVEAVGSQKYLDLALFFYRTGSNNEINVLQRASVSARLVEGNAQEVCYENNDHQYNKGTI
jgi:hypothetical protein